MNDAVNEIKTHPSKIEIFATASNDGYVRLWSVPAERCVARFGSADAFRFKVSFVSLSYN